MNTSLLFTRTFSFFLSAVMVLFSATLQAENTLDLSKLTGNVQQKFKSISKDLHAITAYEDSQPAVSKSGIIPFGFEVGVNASQINLKSNDVFKEIGFDVPTLILPRLYGEINVSSFGLAATYVPLYSGANIAGYKAKYSILDGSTLLPALSFNLNYSSLNGVDTLKTEALGANFGLSKGFLFLTAYANLGISQGTFTPNVAGLSLTKVESQELETVLGIRLGILGIANTGLQLHSIGEHQLATFNIGIGI